MLNNYNKLFLVLGNGLLSKWKYDFSFKYSRYEFLKAKFLKDRLTTKNILNNLYKKIS